MDKEKILKKILFEAFIKRNMLNKVVALAWAMQHKPIIEEFLFIGYQQAISDSQNQDAEAEITID